MDGTNTALITANTEMAIAGVEILSTIIAVSDEEFKMIMGDKEKFLKMKIDIRANKAKAYKEVNIDKSAFLNKKTIKATPE